MVRIFILAGLESAGETQDPLVERQHAIDPFQGLPGCDFPGPEKDILCCFKRSLYLALAADHNGNHGIRPFLSGDLGELFCTGYANLS